MKPCHTEAVKAELKRIGQSGQLTLGKQYAGKLLRVEKLEDGRFVLTPVVDVPESQLWTLQEPHKKPDSAGARVGGKQRADRNRLRRIAANASVSRVRLDLNSPAFLEVFLNLRGQRLGTSCQKFG